MLHRRSMLQLHRAKGQSAPTAWTVIAAASDRQSNQTGSIRINSLRCDEHASNGHPLGPPSVAYAGSLPLWLSPERSSTLKSFPVENSAISVNVEQSQEGLKLSYVASVTTTCSYLWALIFVFRLTLRCQEVFITWIRIMSIVIRDGVFWVSCAMLACKENAFVNWARVSHVEIHLNIGHILEYASTRFSIRHKLG